MGIKRKEWRIVRPIVFIILCIVGFSFSGWADVILTYEALKPLKTPTGQELPAGTSVRLMLSERALRKDIGNHYSFIYKRGGSFFFVNHKERYFIDVGKVIKEAENMRKRLEQELAKLPPEQRALARAMMKSQLYIHLPEDREPCEEPKVIREELVNGIPSKAVDGCKTFEDGQWVACRYWFADGENLGLKREHYILLADFMEFQVKALTLSQRLFGIHILYQPTKKRVLELPWEYPILVKGAVAKDGIEEPYMVFKNVKVEKFSEEVFLIPKGYQDKTMKMEARHGRD